MSGGGLHTSAVVLAGPFATRVLGDMGADVVKINSTERAVGANTPLHPYYIMWNRNKRALALDMSRDDGREVGRALCEQADVVIDNFSVGVLDRWGLGFDAVSEKHPGVIYVQMSGMGEGGPWSRFVTYAPTIHALSGLTHLTGVPGRQDIGIGYSYNDHQAGLHGTVAILAALEARSRTGKGQRVDLSQFEVGVNFLGPALLDNRATGRAAQPVGNHLPWDLAAPHGVYPCTPKGEGLTGERWVAIACMTDAQWQALAGVMGNPSWSADERFATAAGRVASVDALDELVGVWTRDQDAAAIAQRCQSAGVPAGLVQDGMDLGTSDPQLAGANFLHAIDDPHPEIGPVYADRLPLHFEKTPCDEYQRPRTLGEDNASVLEDWLGMSAAEVAAGEASGMLT